MIELCRWQGKKTTRRCDERIEKRRITCKNQHVELFLKRFSSTQVELSLCPSPFAHCLYRISPKKRKNWKIKKKRNKNHFRYFFLNTFFESWNSKDDDWAELVWRAIYVQRDYQKESPTALNYSNVLFISPLFKPKDIQYIVLIYRKVTQMIPL